MFDMEITSFEWQARRASTSSARRRIGARKIDHAGCDVHAGPLSSELARPAGLPPTLAPAPAAPPLPAPALPRSAGPWWLRARLPHVPVPRSAAPPPDGQSGTR